ncbi:MAG: cupin domain-containing protein, partial [Acidimicrobiia bacterium]
VTTLVAQLLLAPATRAADRPIVWVPVGPGAEFSIFTRATTGDPFELNTGGPTGIEFGLVNVEPGGTTGLMPRPGITVTSVVEGVATVLSADGATCGTRMVNTGFALIEQPGTGTEIRNEGPTPLALYTATFTPAGPGAAPLSAGPCPASASKQAAVAILTRGVVDGPLSVESKGASDVYMGAVRFAGHGVIPWHVQHRPLFGAVAEGTLTVNLASGDRCQTGVFPSGAGFHEPAQTVHDVKNNSSRRAMFYYIAFAPTPVPFVAFVPSPRQCESS